MTTWARFVVTRPRATIAVVVPLMLLLGLWGLTVLGRMNLAGYVDPDSESAQVDTMINEAVGRQTPDVLVIYTAPAGRSVDDIAGAVTARFDAVDQDVLARPIRSYWTASPLEKQALVSQDRTKALAVITLRGDDGQRLKSYMDLRPVLEAPGIRTQYSGYSAVTDAFNTRSTHDVVLAEAVAIPLTLLLGVVIFGGLVAAAIPVAVGALTIIGALGALRFISIFTDVSAFAMNVTSLLGLGLAIDYGLFVVSRFREELASGIDPAEAAIRTVQSAGRTVAVSAILMTCAFAGSLVAPIAMLRSLGFGAIAAVDMAALLSLTLVPAVLVLLGHRIDALAWRPGVVQRSERRAVRFWGALADRVLRRRVLVAVLILAGLALLSLPLLKIQTAGIDVRGLPPDDPARIAQSEVTTTFPNATNGATVVVQGERGDPPAADAVRQVLAQLQRTPGVRFALMSGSANDVALVHVVLADGDFSTAAFKSVATLRSLPAPPGTQLFVGGENAAGADTVDAIVRSVPKMLAIMLGATLLVMIVAFRSIMLPIKAVAMATVSLAATFGLLIWVFQEGHGAGLFGLDQGPLPFPALVVVACAVFGLSTDYEVFLMSRMVEAHRNGATTDQAVRTGVARTGRIITAAAMLLIIVTGATALSDVALMKIGGLGMAIAILIDATVVRMLLVPALVSLMGEANWWVPGFLSRRTAERVSVP